MSRKQRRRPSKGAPPRARATSAPKRRPTDRGRAAQPSERRGRRSRRPVLVLGLGLGLVLVVVGVAMVLIRGGSGGSRGVPDPETVGMEPRVAALIGEARRAVLDNPHAARRWGHLGAVLDVHDLPEPAEAAYREAQRLAPREFRWSYHLACVADQLDREPKEVTALYEQAARLAPGYVPLGCRRGDALAAWDRPTEAAAAYRESLAGDPDYAMAHRGLGLSLLALDDAEAALGHLERAAQLLGDDAITQSALARAYGRTGDRGRAARAAERARGAREMLTIPDSVRNEVASLGISSPICSARASVHMAAGRFAEAIEQLLIVEEVHPDDPYVQIRLCKAYMRTGALGEALTRARNAVRLKDDFDAAYVELGRLVMARGELDQAIEHFRHALAIAPGNITAYSKLATALVRKGTLKEALLQYELAAERGRLDAESYVNWALTLVSTGEFAAAVERGREAIEADPDYARAHFGLGYIMQKMGRAEEAIVHHREATRINPDFTEAHLQIARAAEAIGRLEEAIGAYRRVLQINPDAAVTQELAALEARWRSAAPAASAGGDGLPQKPEFLAIAERLYDSDQTYLGEATARKLRRDLEDPMLTASDRVELYGRLARELIELGEPDEAVETIERAFDLIQSVPGARPGAQLHRLRGLVYLRQAEVQNCVLRHNAECCIFPLRGGGVHTVRGPAEQAQVSYRAYLETRPADLTGRWLLNVVAMALGEYPHGVPAELLIGPEAFASQARVGRFRDIAPDLGVDTFNLCGGVIVDDFDRDGLLDIVTSSFDPKTPLAFYRNLGNGRFEDASRSSGADDQLGGLNCIGADYDNDGDIDILILRGAWLLDEGRIRNSLLRNDTGSAGVTFTDVTRSAGLARPAYPTQAAVWGDFDNDGDLDLFIGNESRAMWESESGNFPSQLFINQGDGTFIDRAASAGVTNDRYCKGVAAGDYDNDGDLDLFISNSGPNRLYRNNGDLTFTDVTTRAGVVEPSGRSFAAWFFDYDNDGWLDLFVAAFDARLEDIVADFLDLPFEGSIPRLYRNNRDGTFADVTRAMGLAHMYLPMGANFGDLDNDGWLDIYLTTGDPNYETLVPNVMLRNDRGERFQDVTESGGFGHLQKGHGVSFADFDHDGDQDIYHQLGGFYRGDKFSNALFLNPGHGNHFLAIELVGTRSNRAGYGARITVLVRTPTGPRRIHRAVGSVSSFGGSPGRQEIGLGDADRIEWLQVDWPRSGLRQRFERVPLDTMIRITEGDEEFEERPRVRFRLKGS